ncbi:PREDICTED: serine proteinase stubble [Drosophila arizonae]|uniref:Serine proteinase stubble n=1 Tax=Drosophila arizonae TaxID=7263 RepID=A0ABM1NS87_DROAR|nr:PREDICTED: serine proteinase stubble [Drosophila arizonae]
MEKVLVILLMYFAAAVFGSGESCAPGKSCVSYDLCNEGLLVDGHFYSDRSRTLQDEQHCHYMEKCCSANETLAVGNGFNYSDALSALPQCGGRLDLWLHLRPMGYKKQESKFGEFPWLVAIYGADGYLCSGALITPLAVLTAAHCVQAQMATDLRLVAGEWDAAVELEPLPHQERNVSELLIHPNYTQSPAAHNLALLLLDSQAAFELAPHVQVICLPPMQLLYNYSQCYVAGWRHSELSPNESLPRRWPLYILPRDQCGSKLRLAILGRRFALNETLLCTGGDKDPIVCGDMGAVPLMCPLPGSDDRYVLAGLLARAARCDGPQLLSIYSNVKYYRRWIDQKLSERDLDIRHYMV